MPDMKAKATINFSSKMDMSPTFIPKMRSRKRKGPSAQILEEWKT